MNRARRDLRIAASLALASAALPAEAHSLGIGIVVVAILMTTWPVFCLAMSLSAPPGRRLAALGVALVGYPITYFMIEKVLAFMMRNRPDSRIDDAQWFVMFLQWGIWGAITYFVIRARNDAD